jgi:hypothetical protein
MRRAAPILITLLVLFGLVRLFRIAQQYDPSLGRNAPGQNAEVSIRLIDATLISRDQGKPRWRMHADSIEMHPESYGGLESFRSAEFLGINDGVLYKEGKPEAKFSAGRATFEQGTQTFDIRGGMNLTTPKGDHMEAEQCIWSEREDFVRLPKGGSGSFNGYTLKAPFLLYEPKNRVVQCPQGGEALRKNESIRAAGIMWDVTSGHVHFTGPVSGTRGALNFTVQNLFMDVKKHTMKANTGVARLRIGNEDEPLEGIR